MRKYLILVVGIAVLCAPAFGQQTGSISGKVTLVDGAPIPGVLVTATANVLPQPRTTATAATGEYRLPLLPPGNYQLSFTMEGMGEQVVTLQVLLDQNSTINVTMGPELSETLQVTSSAALIDKSSAELKASVADDVIEALPVGQQYRDLVKLIPGVQYSEDSVRGPSAGGSGQDNVYQFDGVNVNLPLFGTLSAEPASYDIDQVSIVKGGAKAEDFNRAGGFTINTVSKSGTNRFKGLVSFQVQTDGMTGNLDTGSLAEYDEDRDWAVANIGGPIARDKLLFYASYYRPTRTRDNRANAYGEVPDFEDERDEVFAKLTFTPTDRWLLNASYRTSDREQSGTGVGTFETASRATGGDFTQDIAILDGSWVVNDRSFFDFKFTDYANENSDRPDTLFGFPVDASGPGGTALDVNNLDQMGSFGVPTLAACGGDPDCLLIAQDLINRYGYLDGGVPTGGGFVGGDSTINIQDFFRESYELGYNRLFDSGNVSHELNVGYQWYEDSEELNRRSNGWGAISFLGGQPSDGPAGSYYEAVLQQAGTQGFSEGTIVSSYESQNFEINDTIRWNDWSFSVGVLLSNDELFGQDLRANSSNVSGFEISPGSKYKMYEIDWSDMIQPRLGAIWSYDDKGSTLFANYARYHPAASSLPRAASWARNNVGRVVQVFFDRDGNQISSQQLGGSSGKFFEENMDPRMVDEYLVGTARQFGKWTTRAHARYRRGANFWEDTNNNARSRLLAPAGYPQGDYVPDLDLFRAEIGGSSYVIAELDNAFTKYYEASVETEYRDSKKFLRGSYVWSHYYGNFDQDNSSSTTNDFNAFIGSSFIADFAGRQIWNYHYGNLKGDRRHQLKLYGYYNLDWNATVGAYAIYQSGQPWETLNPDYWRCIDPEGIDRNDPACRVTGTGSSNASYRNGSCLDPANGGPGTGVCPYPRAVWAGEETSDDHWQLDLNYTQNFPLAERYNIQVRADLFNVFDEQTGYHIQPDERAAGYGEPRSFFRPRRMQLAVRFEF